jgi:hypothetical protein
MRRRIFLILWLPLLAALVTTGNLTGCQRPQGASSAPRNASASTKLNSLPPAARDLSQDEAQGGHTLSKHVGRTDEQLQQRLAREHGISAASTYTDSETAEKVVGTTLEQQRERIQHWLDRSGEHPNLVLDYGSDQSIGRTLRRGAPASAPCSHAVVVLRYAGGEQYYVLTSYPECR